MRYWKTIMGLMIALTFVLAGCGNSSTGSSSDENSGGKISVEEGSTVQGDMDMAPEQKTEALNAYLEPADQTDPSLDCSFTLEGKTYTLPVDYSVLEADGWETDSDMEKNLDGMTYTGIHMSKPGKNTYIYFDIFNGSGNKARFKDCKLASIEVHKNTLDEYSFAMSNGLKPGDDKETVESRMGAPTSTSDTDQCDISVYGDDRETGQIRFEWWKEEESGEQGADVVTISCFKREESVSSGERPEYLDQYKAPAAMGDDFDSMTVTVDGVIYQLPCPLTEFTKNGWSLKESLSVMAGRREVAYLEKNGVEATIYLNNFADNQVEGENCAVTRLCMFNYGNDLPMAEMILPKGISLTSSLDEIDAAIKSSGLEFKKTEDDKYIAYNCIDLEKKLNVFINYNTEEARISSLDIEEDEWPGMD